MGDTEEKKTKLINISLTQEKLTQIDDWRFENRIMSRSEAIRLLIEIGLKADKQ